MVIIIYYYKKTNFMIYNIILTIKDIFKKRKNKKMNINE